MSRPGRAVTVVVLAALVAAVAIGAVVVTNRPGQALACSTARSVIGSSGTAKGPGETLPVGGTAPVTLRPVAQWATLFDRFWQGERASQEALSRSRDSWDHYELSYAVDALTAAYLATGRVDYVDDALSLVENVVAGAEPSTSLPHSQYHDPYLGWASRQEGGEEVPLYESYFWRYATSLLRVIHNTPALAEDAALQPRYQRLVDFAERDIVEKWYRRGADDNIFRSRTHMAAHWAMITMNLAEVTTSPARRQLYRSIEARIDDELHHQLTVLPGRPGAYFWSDVWGSCRRPGQDVSHGNGVIAYVVEAHDQGQAAWSDADLARFVRTFADVIWPADGQGDGPGSDFVDGSGRGDGWFSDGFVKLGRYDPALQARLENHEPANDQFYANGALNAAILLCPDAAGSPGSPGPAGQAPGAGVPPVCEHPSLG
jgi:hypothetical protein